MPLPPPLFHPPPSRGSTRCVWGASAVMLGSAHQRPVTAMLGCRDLCTAAAMALAAARRWMVWRCLCCHAWQHPAAHSISLLGSEVHAQQLTMAHAPCNARWLAKEAQRRTPWP
eukprot:355682-Chlamydomonas_euryale.AAC.6